MPAQWETKCGRYSALESSLGFNLGQKCQNYQKAKKCRKWQKMAKNGKKCGETWQNGVCVTLGKKMPEKCPKNARKIAQKW